MKVVENSYFSGTLNGEINGGIAGDIKLETAKECTITFTNCYYLNSASAGAVNSKEYTGCKKLSADTLKSTGAVLLGTQFKTARKLQNYGCPVFEWQNILLGDVNADLTFSVDDIVMLRSYLVKIDKPVDFSAADFNNDGLINVFDFIIAKRTLIFK